METNNEKDIILENVDLSVRSQELFGKIRLELIELLGCVPVSGILYNKVIKYIKLNSFSALDIENIVSLLVALTSSTVAIVMIKRLVSNIKEYRECENQIKLNLKRLK